MSMEFREAVQAAPYMGLLDDNGRQEVVEALNRGTSDVAFWHHRMSDAAMSVLSHKWQHLSSGGRQRVFEAAVGESDRDRDFTALDAIVPQMTSAELRDWLCNPSIPTDGVTGRYWYHFSDADRQVVLNQSDWYFFPEAIARHLSTTELVRALGVLAEEESKGFGQGSDYLACVFFLHTRDHEAARPYLKKSKVRSIRPYLDFFDAPTDETHALALKDILKTPAREHTWLFAHYTPRQAVLQHLPPVMRLGFMERQAEAGSMLTDLSADEMHRLTFSCVTNSRYTDRVQALVKTHREQRIIVGLDRLPEKEDGDVVAA